MAALHTAKPATARHGEPVSKIEQLGSGLAQSNTLKPDHPQAPDDAGGDDLTFFSRRPNVCTRTRLPFEDEFPAGVIDIARVPFVHVVTLRDPLTNEPTTRGRGVFYAETDINEVPQ
jgi:hypothetical protein